MSLVADWAFLPPQPPPAALTTLLPEIHAQCDLRIVMCLRDPGKDASGHYHAHKLRDMMSYFDLQDYFAPLLETQASTIATTAADMVRYWDSIRQTIEQKMPQMRAAAEANLTLLECHQRNG